MIKFIIDRSKWLRGEGYYKSFLLRETDNKMCCLGFACIASGFKEENIKGIKMPLSLIITPDWYKDSKEHAIARDASTINDNKYISDSKRESTLKPILKKLDFDVEFIN